MALMPCSECGRQVSTMAFTCPECGAPVDAPAVPGRSPPARAPEPAGAPRLGNRLLAVGALAMVVLGGGADAMVRHWRARPAGETLPAVGKPGPGGEVDMGHLTRGMRSSRDKLVSEMTEQMPGIGMANRFASQAIDSLNELRMDGAARKAEIAVRVTLAEVAQQQEIDDAAYGSYTAKFSALGVTPRSGVSVEMSGGGESWSATATHKDLPGLTCRTGAGRGQGQAGQVFCTKTGS